MDLPVHARHMLIQHDSGEAIQKYIVEQVSV